MEIGSNEVKHLVILRATMMVDTRVIGLVPNLVGDRITIGIIQEVEIDIARVQAGVPLWEGRAAAPSVARICAAQENAAHSERNSARGSNAICVLPRFTIEPLHTVSFRKSRPLHSQT